MPTVIDPAGTRLLEAFRSDVLHGAPLPCTAIHPDDFMLRFFMIAHRGHREGALADYFRTGLAASRTIDRLLSWWFGDLRREIRVLDFASGFGRVTRYLVQHLAPRRLWVADIFPAAVEFQQRSFGVHGFASTAEPERLACAESFDCVIATSLFSHLPAETFERWLRRLYGLLRPGGLLLLSVHDSSLRTLMGKEAARDPSGVRSEAGILYEPASEIPELAADCYGTSWVDAAFVRRVVAAATGGRACARLPRALSSFQDIYAVGRDRDPGTPPLAGEPVGYLEAAERSADGRWITLRGWTHDLHGHGGVTAHVRLDGELVASCPAELPREDVAEAFGDSSLCAGFAVTVGSPTRTLGGETMLSILAASSGGAEFLLHLGSIEGTELRAHMYQAAKRSEEDAAARAEADGRAATAVASAEENAREVARMRASRFWKLRDAWWKVKGLAGRGEG